MSRAETLRWRMHALLEAEAPVALSPQAHLTILGGMAMSLLLLGWPAVQLQLFFPHCPGR
jgi:hypothetical protein